MRYPDECPAFEFRGQVYEGRPEWHDDDADEPFRFDCLVLTDFMEGSGMGSGQHPAHMIFNDEDLFTYVKPLTLSAKALYSLVADHR